MNAERVGVRAVDFINNDDGLEAFLKGLAENEAGLGLGTTKGIDDKNDAVDHFHDTLHFPAKVGVSRSVDDVDNVVAPVNGGVLGLDGDAFFTLQIHRVHGAFSDSLIFTIGATGFEKLVDEGCFAVVNVSDNGEVAKMGHVVADGILNATEADGARSLPQKNGNSKKSLDLGEK